MIMRFKVSYSTLHGYTQTDRLNESLNVSTLNFLLVNAEYLFSMRLCLCQSYDFIETTMVAACVCVGDCGANEYFGKYFSWNEVWCWPEVTSIPLMRWWKNENIQFIPEECEVRLYFEPNRNFGAKGITMLTALILSTYVSDNRLSRNWYRMSLA